MPIRKNIHNMSMVAQDAGKSTKRGFSKKAIARIEICLLFYVPMNFSKA